MILSGTHLVLTDRILSPGTLVVDGASIVEVRSGRDPASDPSPGLAEPHYLVPGFIDLHVHGIEGIDTLDGDGAVVAMAGRFPRYGVTAFCPTTVACAPASLRAVLEEVARARHAPRPQASRVLGAHLESNFIAPAFRGAQPGEHLRTPDAAPCDAASRLDGASATFTAGDVLEEIDRGADSVAIVTLAPEIAGGTDLIRWLAARRLRASVGHSGATFEQGVAALAAGARHAAHLFNRMPPLSHRAPGLVGAVLDDDRVTAELICDGHHLHPAIIRAVVAVKGTARLAAVTDGTAGSGLPAGAQASLGGQRIRVGESTAVLEDGTVAGSVTTMDQVFRVLVEQVGLTSVQAAAMCAATPADVLGLSRQGRLASGALADVVALDSRFRVLRTYIGGALAYSGPSASTADIG